MEQREKNTDLEVEPLNKTEVGGAGDSGSLDLKDVKTNNLRTFAYTVSFKLIFVAYFASSYLIMDGVIHSSNTMIQNSHLLISRYNSILSSYMFLKESLFYA